jgi:hypothetical protein
MFSEGHAHPDGCDNPLQDKNVFLCFFRIVPCWVRYGSLRLTTMSVWNAANFKKVRQMAITFWNGLLNLTRRALKVVKALYCSFLK